MVWVCGDRGPRVPERGQAGLGTTPPEAGDLAQGRLGCVMTQDPADRLSGQPGKRGRCILLEQRP